MNVADIIAALPKLSAADRKKVQAALSVLEKTKTVRGTVGAIVWHALRVEAEKEGVALAPAASWAKSKRAPEFDRRAEHVVAYVDRIFKPKNKTERTQALLLCARALLVFLRELQLPWTFTTIIGNLHNISSAVDMAWPGYVKHGVIRKVLVGL